MPFSYLTKRQIKKAAATVARSEFGSLLYELDLLHYLPRTLFGKRASRDPEVADPASLPRLLQALGPGFVELGHILAARGDLLPANFRQALFLARYPKAPMPKRLFDLLIHHELGVRASRIFSHVDRLPCRLSLLGESRRAVLREGGRVLITVNHPKDTEWFKQDAATISVLFDHIIARYDHDRQWLWQEMRDEFVRRTIEIGDLTQTGSRFELLGAKTAKVFWPFTTPRVLVTEWNTQSSLSAAKPKAAALRSLIDTQVGDYGKSGFWLQSFSPDDWHTDGDDKIILMLADRVGHLPPASRRLFAHLLSALAKGDVHDAAKTLLAAHYEVSSHKNKDKSGILIHHFEPGKTPGETLDKLLVHAWRGNLAVPVDIGAAATSFINFEKSILELYPSAPLSKMFQAACKKLPHRD